VHIHAPDDISVAHKATTPTGPVSAFRLLLPATSRTVAAGSPLTATEAHDADFLAFFRQVLLIFAVLPLRHALVVMTSPVFCTHAMGIAHIERLHSLGLAEVHHLPRPFVPQIAHAPLLLALLTLPGILQAPPAFGAFLAAGLQPREAAESLVMLPFEAADAPPGHDERLAGAGGYRRLMNFSQIDGGLHARLRRRERSISRGDQRRGRGRDHDVQLIAPVPDEGDRPGLGRQVRQMERERRPIQVVESIDVYGLHRFRLGLCCNRLHLSNFT